MTADKPVRPGERVRVPISHAHPCLGSTLGTVLAITGRGVIVEFDRPEPGIIPGGHHGTVAAPEQFEPVIEPWPCRQLRGGARQRELAGR
jgi:hypothetical protein